MGYVDTRPSWNLMVGVEGLMIDRLHPVFSHNPVDRTSTPGLSDTYLLATTSSSTRKRPNFPRVLLSMERRRSSSRHASWLDRST